MRRGINLGNTLDAVPGDRRVLPVEVGHLDVIRGAGFDTVRVPVAWSKHAARTAPFDIDAGFLVVVDELLHGAVERELEVIVDVHHYDELCSDPAAHHDRFLALWAQIAERYADLPATVRFELLNEPHKQLDGPAVERAARRGADRRTPTQPATGGGGRRGGDEHDRWTR